jgi:hypothetical protein
MSTIGSIASGYTSTGSLSTLLSSLSSSVVNPSTSISDATASLDGPSTNVQISIPSPQDLASLDNAMLEAAVQRVAMILYMRAHFEVPPSVRSLGGGIFNVVV